MSININHPQDDISTDGGNPPTLGGGPPSVKVMSTGTATATYYAKLATLAFPATNNVAANLSFILTPKSASGSYPPVIVTATVLQGTSGLSASSKVSMLSSDETAIAHNDLFLVTSAATNGTNIELHMQSIIAAAYDVQLLSSSFDTGVSVSAWNDSATWSATDPTIAAAVSVTSDWAGSGPWVPTIIGLTTAGAGTYSAQVGNYQRVGGYAILTGRVTWSAHTGTGNMALGNFPFTSASSQQCAGQLMHGGIAGTGDMAAYIAGGFSQASLYSVALGSSFSSIALDTAGDIIFTLIYKAA